MPHSPADRRVYRLPPWRRYLAVLAFLPLWLPLGLAAVFSAGRERWICLGILVAILILVGALHWIIGRVRLELSPEGVRLVGFSGSVEAAWPDVVGVRLDRGREGLVTGRPLEGRLAAGLAAYRNTGSYGTPWYDAEQVALMAERRLIPLDVFRPYLRRGDLIADIVRFAPHLQGDCTAGPRPAPTRTRGRGRETLGVLVGGVLFAGLMLWAMMDARVWSIVFPLFLCLLATISAWSAVNYFRDGARLTAAITAIFALMLLVFGVAGIAEGIRGPSAAPSARDRPGDVRTKSDRGANPR